jgi:quinol monooxygenase YgiN
VADGFVVIAEFELQPGSGERFQEFVAVNAASSIRDEPGCRRFDVLLPEGVADRVTLYEIYDDRDAFDAHLRTPHFAAFKQATDPIVLSIVGRRFDLQEHAKPI